MNESRRDLTRPAAQVALLMASIAITGAVPGCGGEPPDPAGTGDRAATQSQALVDLTSCGPQNLALNPAGSGTPSPLQSDPGVGDPWQLVDGNTEYALESSGLAFDFGGTHEVTIDLGGLATVDELTVWHHGDDEEAGHNVPAEVGLEYFDGGGWLPVTGFSRDHDLAYPQPPSGFGSIPDVYGFAPIVGSKLRWSYDGNGPSVLPAFGNPVLPGDPMLNDAESVAAGLSHVCAVRATGHVSCWGWGHSGQLGYGSNTTSFSPVEVVALADAVGVGPGDQHTCAARASGEVSCWGANGNGRLGDGTTTPSLTPVGVVGLADAVAVSAGSAHSCALRSTGQVACWGSNNRGQLGNGTFTGSPLPVAVSGVANAVALAVDRNASCALLTGGAVVCWGDGELGQLGNGTTAPTSTPVPVLGIGDAVAVSVGADHACALRAGGQMVCWGGLEYPGGQLGNGNWDGSTTPVTVTDLSDATKIAAGAYLTCARRATGEVLCWGLNESGGLGDGTTHDSPVPVTVSLLGDAVDVTTGYNANCALRSGGRVVCWGASNRGTLGSGERPASSTPVAAAGLTNAVGVVAGYFHTCALTAGGGLDCWGRGAQGQLGTGTFDPSSIPVSVTSLPGPVIGAGAHSLHTCAVLATGQVACWGYGDRGALGYGGTENQATPVLVSGLSDAIAVTAGFSHSCAVRQTGEVACWGSQEEVGLLGNGSGEDSPTPVPVPGIGDAIKIAAGPEHTCVIHSGGGVSCWGRGNNGRLGHGSGQSSSTPVSVLGLSDAVGLALGLFHSCAVRATGGVACWGGGGDGALGDGTMSNRNTPVQVLSLNDAVAVSAGAFHSCAERATGQVVCWGNGEDGQLGNGIFYPGEAPGSPTPVPVSGLGDAVSIASGAEHTCVARATGEVACWGMSNFGAMGNGQVAYSTVPVSVVGYAGIPWKAWPYQVSVHGCPELAAPESAAQALPPGGTLTTDTEGDGATLADPIETAVTTPSGGQVSIQEAPLSGGPTPNFVLFGQEIQITAPPGSVAAPLVITFTVDASLLPAGAGPDDVDVFKNGTLVRDCAGSSFAIPNPCVASRALVGGDVVITVRTTSASTWTLGIALFSDVDADGVKDRHDACPDTASGDAVDTLGCSVSQHCPCAGAHDSGTPWKNHGEYVSCVTHAVNEFLQAGLIDRDQGQSLRRAAARSECGH